MYFYCYNAYSSRNVRFQLLLAATLKNYIKHCTKYIGWTVMF